MISNSTAGIMAHNNLQGLKNQTPSTQPRSVDTESSFTYSKDMALELGKKTLGSDNVSRWAQQGLHVEGAAFEEAFEQLNLGLQGFH